MSSLLTIPSSNKSVGRFVIGDEGGTLHTWTLLYAGGKD